MTAMRKVRQPLFGLSIAGAVLAALLSAASFLSAREPAASTVNREAAADERPKELVSGKVVLLADALTRRGIQFTEEMRGQVVVETAAGELWPIVADWRGRAFFQDERLRNRPVDLIVRRTAGTPYLQVLTVYTFDEKGVRNYTDYWCDICSIPMFEIKDCECCQGPTRLRYQPQELPEGVRPLKSLLRETPADERPSASR